ncbi:leucine-rich repeat neuronal protein 3-like [Limulus polyphemus]|uniref:Leucine-rich repeat neuronal protein 3-like n=1 Tax=Limulus polyphemus TaxID=6850 RepID=A0ABM1BNK5_LIMPO|nr:leucine-rich repeat neuronal protein 3-like [Limulus polyphemus]
MITFIFLMLSILQLGEAGSPCPPAQDINPWFCINTPTFSQSSFTTVICNRPGCNNSLERVDGLRGQLLLDRVVISNVQRSSKVKDKNDDGKLKLPPYWLKQSRVRELEIRNTTLSNCSFCDNPLDGQEFYLNKLVISNCFLRGKICVDCPTRQERVQIDNYNYIYVNVKLGFETQNLKHLKSLEKLDLSFNKFEEITNTSFPSDLINLKNLVLCHNNISLINTKSFAIFPSLTVLDLSYNQLKNISRDIFTIPDGNLEILNLSYNRISVLPKDMFLFMMKLREVVLANNFFQSLPYNTWNNALNVIETIDVAGNFIVCDCGIKWIATNLTSITKLNGWCSSPWSLENKPLRQAARIISC